MCGVAGLFGGSHQFERRLLEWEIAGAPGESVEQGLREQRNIVCGGKETGVSGDSTHAARGGVVDIAAKKLVEVGVCVDSAFIVMRGGSDVGDEAGAPSPRRANGVTDAACRRTPVDGRTDGP